MSGEFIIDRFTVESGRDFVGIVKDGKLLVRAFVNGQHRAVNFNEAGAERMGIMLCKFLEHKRNEAQKDKFQGDGI